MWEVWGGMGEGAGQTARLRARIGGSSQAGPCQGWWAHPVLRANVDDARATSVPLPDAAMAEPSPAALLPRNLHATKDASPPVAAARTAPPLPGELLLRNVQFWKRRLLAKAPMETAPLAQFWNVEPETTTSVGLGLSMGACRLGDGEGRGQQRLGPRGPLAGARLQGHVGP